MRNVYQLTSCRGDLEGIRCPKNCFLSPPLGLTVFIFSVVLATWPPGDVCFSMPVPTRCPSSARKRNTKPEKGNNPDCRAVKRLPTKKKKKKKVPKCFTCCQQRHSRSLSWDVMSSSCDGGKRRGRLESGVAFQVAHLLFRVATTKSESATPPANFLFFFFCS